MVKENREGRSPQTMPSHSCSSLLFFGLFILAYDLYRSWRRTFCLVFPSAVCAVAAHCKLPFCPPPRHFPRRCKAERSSLRGVDCIGLTVGFNKGTPTTPRSFATPKQNGRGHRRFCQIGAEQDVALAMIGARVNGRRHGKAEQKNLTPLTTLKEVVVEGTRVGVSLI